MPASTSPCSQIFANTVSFSLSFSGYLILTIHEAADKTLENLKQSTLAVPGPRKSLRAYQQLWYQQWLGHMGGTWEPWLKRVVLLHFSYVPLSNPCMDRFFLKQFPLLQAGGLNLSWDIRVGTPWIEPETNISGMCPQSTEHSDLCDWIPWASPQHQVRGICFPKGSVTSIECVWPHNKSTCTFISSSHPRGYSCSQDMVAKAVSQSLFTDRECANPFYL